MPRLRTIAALAIAATLFGACSSSGASPAASAAAPASQAASAAASAAASGGAASAAASVNPDQMKAVTGLEAKSVGSLGNVLIASNGYTVYTFTKDTKDSGK